MNHFKSFIFFGVLIFVSAIETSAAESKSDSSPEDKWEITAGGWKVRPLKRGVYVSVRPTDSGWWHIVGYIRVAFPCPTKVHSAKDIHRLFINSDHKENEILLYVNSFKICPEEEKGLDTHVTYNVSLGDFNREEYPTVQSLPKFIISGEEALVYSYYPDGSLATYPEIPPSE